MKKWLPIILICLISFISLTPKVGIFAYTQDDYYNVVGTYFLSSMLASGEATELDFSSGDGDIDFLTALGEAIITGDYSGLIQYGLSDIEDSIITSIHQIDNAVYEMNPEFYEFLVGEDNGAPTRISIKPSYGTITRHLLNDLDSNDTTPPPDTSSFPANFYKINSLEDNDNSFWIGLKSSSDFIYSVEYFRYDPKTVTWYNANSNGFTRYGGGITRYYCCFSNCSAYITFDGTSYYLSFTYDEQLSWFGNNAKKVCNFYYGQSGSQIGKLVVGNTSNNSYTLSNQSFNTLENCCNWIINRFRNIDVYYNGELFFPSNYNSELSSSPISLGNNLTILNNYPAQYYYNEPVYFDMSSLLNIVKNAINQSNVLTYNDIKDLIVDVNGQEAVAVVNFYRTDYDVLASEQLPYYPKFYYDINLNQYAQAGAQIVNISTEVLPRDVLNIIITCGVILLFGYVVRRLLE